MAKNKTKAELEAELEEQQKQLEMMRAMFAAFGIDPNAQKKPAQAEANRKKDVTITNLSEGKLILKDLNGRTYSLDEQFASRKITREQCRSIVENMPSTYLAGYFALCEKGREEIADLFTQKEIDSIQNDVLTAEQLRNIFTLDIPQIEAIYQRVKPAHKELITNKLRGMIERGESVDIRLKEALSNLSGFDYINLKPLDEDMLEMIRSHGGKV